MGLENVNIGDFIRVRSYGSDFTFYKVTRVTKTLVICAVKNIEGEFYDVKFSKEGHSVPYSKWGTKFASPSNIEEYQKYKNEQRLKKYWVDLRNTQITLSQIQKIKDALEEPKC